MTLPAPEIRSYRLDPAAFEPTTKRRIYRRYAVAVPILAVFLVAQFAFMARLHVATSDTLRIAIPVIVALLGFSLFRAAGLQLKNGKSSWDSYQLTVGPNVLRRFIANLPPVEILRTEVTQIVESRAEGITVMTADRHRFLFVPKELVGFEEVRAGLSTWRGFDAPKVVRTQAIGAGWSILLIGSWIATGVVPDMRLAMLAGVVLLATAAFTMREISKLGVADSRQKAATVGGLALLMLAPFARLVLHFVFKTDVQWPR